VKIILVVLVLVLASLQYRLWVGEGSLAAVNRLHEAIAAQKKENAELQERNRRLEAEVEELKKGRDAVEERARRDLGMIHKDETFFQIVED